VRPARPVALAARRANHRANVTGETGLPSPGTFTRVTPSNVPIAPDLNSRGTFTR
jgi:hypothetical protein